MNIEIIVYAVWVIFVAIIAAFWGFVAGMRFTEQKPNYEGTNWVDGFEAGVDYAASVTEHFSEDTYKEVRAYLDEKVAD